MTRNRTVVLLPVAALAGYALGRRAARGGSSGRRAADPAASSADAGHVPRGAIDPGRAAPAAEVPGIDAETPTGIPPAGWWQIIRRAFKETGEDGVSLMAAGVAFYAFLSVFPALIAAVSLYGLVADPEQVQRQIEDLTAVLPRASAELIGDQLTEITSHSGGALGVGLVVSVLGALFTASGGVANLIQAINVAYDEKETRGIVRLRALALLLTLGAILFLAVAVALVAVLPVVLDSVGLGSFGRFAVQVARWGGLLVFVVVALAILYRYTPDRDDPRFSWVSLGAVVATLLWLLGSVGFSVFVSRFGNYDETYGALAGVVVLLLWLFLTAFVVLFGAEINSEMEQQTIKDSTVGPPRPLGQRNAVKADTIPAPADTGH